MLLKILNEFPNWKVEVIGDELEKKFILTMIVNIMVFKIIKMFLKF